MPEVDFGRVKRGLHRLPGRRRCELLEPVRARIDELHRTGHSLAAISRELGVSYPHGARARREGAGNGVRPRGSRSAGPSPAGAFSTPSRASTPGKPRLGGGPSMITTLDHGRPPTGGAVSVRPHGVRGEVVGRWAPRRPRAAEDPRARRDGRRGERAAPPAVRPLAWRGARARLSRKRRAARRDWAGPARPSRGREAPY